jgi:hypothetical protein
MIVYKTWKERTRDGTLVYQWVGYFLLGFIPLYLKRYSLD